MTEKKENHIDHAAEIVSAYVANNPVSKDELTILISNVHNTLAGLSAKSPQDSNTKVKTKPAVPVSKSVHPEYLICLECGRKMKSLKRHLRAYHDQSPEEYRIKWNLPPDYPMVASAYSERRTEIAKEFKLGRRKGQKVRSKAA